MEHLFPRVDSRGLLDTRQATSAEVDRYEAESEISNFPRKVDALKSLDFSDANMSQVNTAMTRYYELIRQYIQSIKDGTTFSTAEASELSAISKAISLYNLSSTDYITMRDALIEIMHYLNSVVHIDLYGTPADPSRGVYNKLVAAITGYQTELNRQINEMNAAHARLHQVFPEHSITENYLTNDLRRKLSYISMSNGIAIRRDGAAPTLANTPTNSDGELPMVIVLPS